MKILMIASNKDSKVKNHFVDLVKSNFKNQETTITITDLENVKIVAGKELKVIVGRIDVTAYNLIVFRGIKSCDQSLASSIAMCLKFLKVDFIDKVYGEMGISEKKLGSLLKLYTAGINIPESVYYSSVLTSTIYLEVKNDLGLPFVAKDLFLQRGKGVFLVSSEKDFLELPKREYLFQRYLDKEKEYRVLVLGKKVGVYEEKIAANKNEFRNNVALGAKEVFFNKKDITKSLEELATKAAGELNLQIAGVDIVIDKKGKEYIFEVNRGPGLTYDEKISPEFKEIAEFLENYA
jgi:glutathione synthase/RimK-type ligase-like ATP-grasp enzyme